MLKLRLLQVVKGLALVWAELSKRPDYLAVIVIAFLSILLAIGAAANDLNMVILGLAVIAAFIAAVTKLVRPYSGNG